MPEYFEAILAEGHRLAKSRINDGAFSGNSFDDLGNLARPDFLPVDDLIKRKVAIGVAIGVAVGFAAGAIVAVKAAPHIKSQWSDLKSKWNRILETSEADSQAATVEMAVPSGTSPADFSKEVDVALEEIGTSMSNAEAQRRLLAILLAAAFIADQMRSLSTSRVDDDAPLELRSAMDKLAAPQITDSINRMLEGNFSILDEETSTKIMKIFGGGRFVDGRYVPLQNEEIKDVLRLTDGEI